MVECFTFFKLYKCYQIAQRTTYISRFLVPLVSFPTHVLHFNFLRIFSGWKGQLVALTFYSNLLSWPRLSELLKKAPIAGIFQWILRNFSEYIFHRKHLGDYILEHSC